VTKGVLALLGSGEIAPSMTKVHRELFKSLDDVRAVSLDTPYGFQANVPQMTEKIVEYFATSLRTDITPLHFTSFDATNEVERAQFRQQVRAASYVFSGPGSPSYALCQWSPLGLASDLIERLRSGAVVSFASAAAVTIGAFTAPIYEIYKVGIEPYWLDGLDVLSEIGLRAAVIPHFDNAEGGNYDTRYCYIGAPRLERLERLLPEGTGILGVDEHTAAIFDLDTDTLRVRGKSGVYWRLRGVTQSFPSGSTVEMSQLRNFEPPAATPTSHEDAAVSDLDALVALAAKGGPSAIDAIAALATLASSGGSGQMNPAPLIDGLLALRTQARGRNDFSLSDQIRDLLVATGINVMDGPDGSTWTLI
jgi:hypothetical protein